MSEAQIRSIKRALEDAGVASLAALGRELGVPRQTVSKVLRMPTENAKVRTRIIEILGRDPWAEPPGQEAA